MSRSTKEKRIVDDAECDFIVFTDGACHPNPGIGGWGFVLINKHSGDREYHYGGERKATNNRMELMAMIRAVEKIMPNESLLILTDSKLMVNTFTRYIGGWRNNNWRKSDGTEIKNLDLIKEMALLMKTRKVKFQWIKGHAGISGNEQADGLANMGRKQLVALNQETMRVHLADYADFRAGIKRALADRGFI